ncbi:MAG: DNA polymerase III subunit delta' [Campylobacterota bacterium]|nr:DNA polymerase III subunit delta' [Campylobacterota bacterium]
MKSSRSHILISSEFENIISDITNELKPHRVVPFLRDEFKIEDAKSVIKEAYVSESENKYIIIASQNINVFSQNSLLKILEEPPRNTIFILIVPSKSILLPTIRSRLPLFNLEKKQNDTTLDINLKTLDLAELFDFVKANERVNKFDAKNIVSALLNRAVFVDEITLNRSQSEAFELGFKLIELNSRASSIFTMILMTFLRGSKR